MSKVKIILPVLFLLFSTHTFAAQNGKYFDRAIFVIFENKNYSDVLNQPFFSSLAKNGALFSNFNGITHPSQPNYIALTSGSLNNVKSDFPVNLNVNNVADLLEAKGLTWKVYAEDYPGNCFTGITKLAYARKHNPFISYLNIQTNPSRCANIVNADQFDHDAVKDALPNYVFYVPNDKNNGHDTSLAYADKWYSQKFSKYLTDVQFMRQTVLITTFDESEPRAPRNQIFTTITGPMVKAGTFASALNSYSLLNLVEENWGLGNLGQNDVTAAPIPDVWQH